MNNQQRDNESRKAQEGKLDVGAEEFSEQIYDDKAPTPPEFDEPHSVSITGSELKENDK